MLSCERDQISVAGEYVLVGQQRLVMSPTFDRQFMSQYLYTDTTTRMHIAHQHGVAHAITIRHPTCVDHRQLLGELPEFVLTANVPYSAIYGNIMLFYAQLDNHVDLPRLGRIYEAVYVNNDQLSGKGTHFHPALIHDNHGMQARILYDWLGDGLDMSLLLSKAIIGVLVDQYRDHGSAIAGQALISTELYSMVTAWLVAHNIQPMSHNLEIAIRQALAEYSLNEIIDEFVKIRRSLNP